jgi:hypothetical protein
MGNGHFAVEGSVVLERRSVRVPVRASRGNVEVVEDTALLNQGAGIQRELHKQLGYRVAPGFLTKPEVESLHGLLRCLLAREAGPFM